MKTDDDAARRWTVPMILVPGLLAAIFSLSFAAFLDQRGTLQEILKEQRATTERLDRLEGADVLSQRDRDALRQDLAVFRTRQERVMAALAAHDPKLAEVLLKGTTR